MYLNILLVQEQQGQQAEKQDGEIGLWAPLATQCCYCKFTTSLLSSPLRALFASTHTCPENANSVVSKPADSGTEQGWLVPLQLTLFWYCLDDLHNTVHLISTAISSTPFCFILLPLGKKTPRMLHANQPVEKKQQ